MWIMLVEPNWTRVDKLSIVQQAHEVITILFLKLGWFATNVGVDGFWEDLWIHLKIPYVYKDIEEIKNNKKK